MLNTELMMSFLTKILEKKIPTSQPSIETVSLSQESEPARDSIEEYLTYLISHLNLRRGNKLEETFNLFYSNTF